MRAAALLDTDPQAAAQEAQAILKQDPGHAAARLLLAAARRSAGDPAAAADFRALATEQPESPALQLELGRTLAAQGDADGAFAALKRAVVLQPDLAEAWHALAAQYAARASELECDRAYAHYQRLTQPERHLAEAAAAVAARRLPAADTLLRARLASAPTDVVALRLLADVAALREDYAEAERLLREALRLEPGYSGARFALARVLHSQQKPAPMLSLLERLLALEPDNFRYRTLQASAYNMLGQNERARQIHEALLQKFADSDQLWVYYGHSLRIAGRLTEAVAAYRKSIALNPAFGEAWFSLGNLKTVHFSDDDIAIMESQVAREHLDYDSRLQFEFALGKAREDRAQYGAAFEHYARGNSMRRAMVNYQPAAMTRLVERSVTLFSREFLAARAGWGSSAPDPIFIVGLPRSGSTLVEQILASHSQVEGTRELPDVPGFALELGAMDLPGKPPTYPQSLAQLSRAHLLALGERYLRQTQPHRVLGRPRFLDKMPNNFLHAGLIHLMLPQARIIDVRRGALAACFANFKQHFQQGVWFTYSLEDLGQYYRDYVRLMHHFDQVLPGRVLHVRYEDLVQDTDAQVRRLLEYCGLPFEDRCLRFYETERPVQTVSSEQVRRPIYTDSLEQWRHFEPWLGPLKSALGELAEQP
ncbi:MAG: sulfotransferase [Gammaproteobacteria bacterium]|nr:sulfotransferase [Gammaproteobacteria bacterium]MBV9696050.1 sulfotransferase [Gammaproteobacteria bacterium]